MTQYSFRALDKNGKIIKGTLDSASPFDLESRLHQQGLELIRHRVAFSELKFFRRKVKRKELINFCFQLEQMTQAGIPLIDGLQDLYQETDPGFFRHLLASLVEDVQGGLSLSQALAKHPMIFDSVFVSLVAAGESSGSLPEVFRRLATTLKWLDELISQIIKILIYPIFTLLVIFSVFLFLMLFLVPQLASFMQNMNVALPFQTRLLLGTSSFIKAHWFFMLIVMIGVPFGLLVIVHRSQTAKILFDRFKLKIPYVGNVLKKIILARFTGLFALLYASGISIVQAMQMLQHTTGNIIITRALILAAQTINEGKPISEAFRETKFFPSLIIRMLRIGELTGKLDTALENASYFYLREVQESIAKIQAMIGPILTVFLGGLLGWLMLAVLGPLYDMLEKIKF